MSDRKIEILSDQAALVEAAAQHILDLARSAVHTRGHFTIALAGGSTPRKVYERLAHADLRDHMPWDQLYVFWSDDRAVPPDHPDSNYRMAREALLKQVPLPKDQIKPMLSSEELKSAAQHYARVIQSFVPGTPPRFDLVMLGMGPDGHCASLFPHSPQLAATSELVVATPIAPLEPHVRRLTFTKTLINAAAEVLFLVTGADKAARLKEVLQGPYRPDDLPAQLPAPTSGTLRWMVDQVAAGELDHRG